MRSRCYHVIILGEPKVNILRVIEKNSKDIERYAIAKHNGHIAYFDKIHHTHIALQFREPKLPIWISRRFKVKLKSIEPSNPIIFQYVR